MVHEGTSEVEIRRGSKRTAPHLLALFALVCGGTAVAVLGVGSENDGSPRPATSTTEEQAAATTTTSAVERLAADGTEVEVRRALSGRPLDGPTGLEILIGATLVDLDHDRTTTVGGSIDSDAPGAVWARTFRAGVHSIVVRHSASNDEHTEVEAFVLRQESPRPELVISGMDLALAPADDGVWVTRQDDHECTIEKVGFDGSPRTAARAIGCRMIVSQETDLGLHAHSWADPDGVPIPTDYVLDVTDLSVRAHARHILAVSDDRLLLGDGHGYEIRSDEGLSEPLDVPAAIGQPTRGSVSPDGRYALVPFVGAEADMWIVDLHEAVWHRIPSFPAQRHPRAIEAEWADDGRLVLLWPATDEVWPATDEVWNDRSSVLATWRPGDPELSVREIDHPYGDLTVHRAR